MFFDTSLVYNRLSLLRMETTGLEKIEADRLRLINDKALLKTDLLPTPRDVVEFYTEHGISEERAFCISRSYSNKLDMFMEFQHGFSVSISREMELLGSDMCHNMELDDYLARLAKREVDENKTAGL